MRKRKIAVIAGSYSQFMDFSGNSKDDEDYIYIDHRDKVRGLQFDGLLIIGSYYDRPDLSELEDEIKARIV